MTSKVREQKVSETLFLLEVTKEPLVPTKVRLNKEGSREEEKRKEDEHERVLRSPRRVTTKPG